MRPLHLLFGVSLVAAPLGAQTAAPSPATAAPTATAIAAPTLTLSLVEAVKQAKASSPIYRQTLNDIGPARAAVKAAVGGLLPSASASGSLSYTGAGNAAFSGTLFTQPATYGSNWNVSAQWTLNGSRLVAVGQQRANERATQADIASAERQIIADVTVQYLTTLQAAAQQEVAQQQVKRNDEFLSLAQARYRIGQANLLDVRQAETTRGGSQVAYLRAVQGTNEAKLELFRRIGTPPPADVRTIALSDSFAITQPSWELDALLRLAEAEQPGLKALRERELAQRSALTAARSQYYPSATLTASIGGFTQQYANTDGLVASTLSSAQAQAASCQRNNTINQATGAGPITADCFGTAGLQAGGAVLKDSVVQAINSRNSTFPFNFTRNPFQLTLGISYPIFTGWSRPQQVAIASAAQQDAEERVRQQALQLRADVNARWLGVQTAYEVVEVQRQNRESAADQLRLAQERYRIGNGTALELADAENAVARTAGDYISAVYDYHRQVALLELAIGRPLRTTGE